MSIAELARMLFVSEPTVRRDIARMRESDTVSTKGGVASLKVASADKRIPLFVRDAENNGAKRIIGRRAAELVRDGDVIMLDASTTAYHMVEFLENKKDIFVITSGIRSATVLAGMGIRTVLVGGEIISESLSFAGADAERTLRAYNADKAFFSCRSLSSDGLVTDNSISENSIRRIMIEKAADAYLLCDSTKLGKKCLNTLCHTDELAGVITENDGKSKE